MGAAGTATGILAGGGLFLAVDGLVLAACRFGFVVNLAIGLAVAAHTAQASYSIGNWWVRTK